VQSINSSSGRYSVRNVTSEDRLAYEANSLDSNDEGSAPDHSGEIRLLRNEDNTWWSFFAQRELAGGTAMQAWSDGDIDHVTALVHHWYEQSKPAVNGASDSPTFLELLRQKSSEYDDGPLGDDSIRRSA